MAICLKEKQKVTFSNVPVIFYIEKISLEFADEPDWANWDEIEEELNVYKRTMQVHAESCNNTR